MDKSTLAEIIINVSTALFGVIVTIVALVPALLEFISSNSSSALEASLSLDKIRIHLRRLSLLLPILSIVVLLIFLIMFRENQALLFIDVSVLACVLALSTIEIFKLVTEIRELL